jgi:hypothetical protein
MVRMVNAVQPVTASTFFHDDHNNLITIPLHSHNIPITFP